jgi:predicted kinase
MDQFFAQFFLLDEPVMMALFFALGIAGGVAGPFLFEVRLAFRRVVYFWWFACLNLALVISQLIWLAAPAAAEMGHLSVVVMAGLATFFLFGLGLYYGSAARSNHIDATTSNAWLGFVPFANLWLMFKAGDPALKLGPERSTFARYVLDPVLVVLAILVLATANVAADASDKLLESRTADATALQNLVSQGQTVSELFALEAAASSKDLPVRIDELTILTRLAIEHDALIEIVSMDVPLEQAVAGNRMKASPVPEDVLRAMAQEREPAIADEAHRLISIDKHGAAHMNLPHQSFRLEGVSASRGMA